MEYLAKKPISFLQDRAFTSNNLNVYTSKWNILQKKPFSFLQDRSFTSNNVNVYTSKWNILQKKPISFLQDRSFTSNNINVYTSKWNILQKSRFPFWKIAHLLVIILMFVLVNGISCKNVDFLFARSLIC